MLRSVALLRSVQQKLHCLSYDVKKEVENSFPFFRYKQKSTVCQKEQTTQKQNAKGLGKLRERKPLSTKHATVAILKHYETKRKTERKKKLRNRSKCGTLRLI